MADLCSTLFFPEVVAGDPGRAAFAFFGSETGGNQLSLRNGEDCSPAPPFQVFGFST